MSMSQWYQRFIMQNSTNDNDLRDMIRTLQKQIQQQNTRIKMLTRRIDEFEKRIVTNLETGQVSILPQPTQNTRFDDITGVLY